MTSFHNNNKATVVGPWGSQSGTTWDDGVYTGVRQIVVTHGAGIDSIQIEYDKQGSPFWADKHGGTGGYRTDKVKLSYPEEFLSSMHGYYGPLYSGGPICVRSLTLIELRRVKKGFINSELHGYNINRIYSEVLSNLRTYGPFGVDQGSYFYIPKTGDKIVGFFGRYGWYLDAIGAYMKPIHQNIASNAVVYSQGYVAHDADRRSGGYSVIQGSLGKEYDIVLAIKQRDNFSSTSPSIKGVYTNPTHATLSRQSSSSDSSSDDDSDEKATIPPPSIERRLSVATGVVRHGPWGGSGGTAFDDGCFTGIRQITLSRNVGIVYLKAIYEKDGEVVRGGRNGGTGGFRHDKIVIDYPFEILTHITGHYGSTMIGLTIIKSLTFHTTKRKYGPYGEEHGVPFTSKSKEGMIVGFHGKKGLFLDAIGVHVKEGKVTPQVRPPPTPQDDTKRAIDGDRLWPSKPPVSKGTPYEEPAFKVVKEPAPFGTGPWGGEGGKPWDDGVYTGIKQIFLTRSEVICSMQIEYDRNGQSVWSVKHGSDAGTKTHRIKLEYPNEVLTCISGYYSAVGNDHGKVIRSLTFYTSRGKYGPFGDEVGTFFTSTTTEGMVLGFHGRSGSYLDAIGVHMQHWLGSNKQPKTSFFNMFG